MHSQQIGESHENHWDEFVGRHDSTLTDYSAWRHVLRDTYGIRSYFLAAYQGSDIAGTLGLFELKHPVFGHYLTTAAFATDGGLFYDSEEARDILIRDARKLADDLGVEYLLIRTRESLPDGFQTDNHYRTAVIDQSVGADTLWSDVLPGKTRNQVRRGKKEGFTLQEGHDCWLDFYKVFHRHMRDLGSPAHGRNFYRNIIRYLGDHCRFVVVRDQDELAGGALLFEIGGTAVNYHTVSLRQFNRRCPNYLLYWDMIESSANRGNCLFDMGRTEADSSNLKFKMNWGPRVVDLKYNYYLRKIPDIPYLDPRNSKYRLPIAVWRKLPLRLTSLLGPWLIKGIA
jgi:FemAB-related protein (PEP-CTERM system-associated)